MKINILIHGDKFATKADLFRKKLAKLPDGEYTLEIKRKNKTRSVQQNKMYWDILGQVEDQTGMLAYEIHETMRATYLVDYSGSIAKVGSTTDLDSREFTNYINQVVSHLAHFAVIQMPEDK